LAGFAVLPKRWIGERSIAWLNRCRRLAKHWQNLSRDALGFLKLASIRLMRRKLRNPSGSLRTDSKAEICLGKIGAGDEIRTHDPNLGKRGIAVFVERSPAHRNALKRAGVRGLRPLGCGGETAVQGI